MYARRLLLFLLLLATPSCTPAIAHLGEPPVRWWKGNLHAHSLWSDGDHFPDMVLDWYRRNGYAFASLTDQDVVPATGRWINLARDSAAAAGIAEYRARFPRAVDERTRNDTTFVRLATASEYRFTLEEPNVFLVLPGQEITHEYDAGPVHIGAWNLTNTVMPTGDASPREMIRANVRAVQEQAAHFGRVAAAQVNHPNYGGALTAEDLITTPGLRLFELYNGRPDAANAGDSTRVGTERMWDIALAGRVARGLPPIWGTAADDAAHFHTTSDSARIPGRAWIVARAPALTPDAIMRAVLQGEFYASTGVELEEVTGTTQRIALRIREEPGVTYATEFIGTRRDADVTGVERHDTAGHALTRLYGDEIGEVLAVVYGSEPSYIPNGDELYVRARVTSSKPKTNAAVAGEYEMAWTQPVIIARPEPTDSTLTVVTLNLWHDQRDWPSRMDAIVAELRRLEPDVIALQEVLQHDSLPNQAMDIARSIGYDWYFASVDSVQRTRRYGNAILTKHPILARNWVALEPLDDYRNATHVRIVVGGRDVDVFVTHLHHTMEGDSIRRRQVEHLARFIERTRGTGPVVIAGDFNTAAAAPELRPLLTAFVDAYGAVHPEANATTPTTLVTQLGHSPARIDHVFVERASLRPVSARLLFEEPIGDDLWPSDHFGVLVELRFSASSSTPR